MGTSDLPEMYTSSPQVHVALGHRVYISGRPRVHMLQL